MSKILVVEDDTSIVENLTPLLEESGFKVVVATTQKEALAQLDSDTFDIVLLDLGLPDGHGFTVCSHVKHHDLAPVIILSANDDEMSVVTGLDLGSDDFISKPYRPKELISRINTVLRRSGKKQSVVRVGSIEIDAVKGIVRKDQQEVPLSALEYRLLLAFVNHKGAVLTRDQLFEEIWDVAGEYVSDNTLTVYIKRLREKLEGDPSEPQHIKTVRGFGYKLDD